MLANIVDVEKRIALAAERVGRKASDVRLIAVSKGRSAAEIEELQQQGIKAFGENYVQEFIQKYDVIEKDVEWHFIGHLQRNKAKYLAGKIRLIHSLDNLELARVLHKLKVLHGGSWQVLVQVNIAEEPTKYGVHPSKLSDFLDEISDLDGVEVCGLMTIAPFYEEPEATRPIFRKLYELKQEMEIKKRWLNLRHLSMGMSNDFEIAVEEGATLVRIGRALFGNKEN